MQSRGPFQKTLGRGGWAREGGTGRQMQKRGAFWRGMVRTLRRRCWSRRREIVKARGGGMKRAGGGEIARSMQRREAF